MVWGQAGAKVATDMRAAAAARESQPLYLSLSTSTGFSSSTVDPICRALYLAALNLASLPRGAARLPLACHRCSPASVMPLMASFGRLVLVTALLMSRKAPQKGICRWMMSNFFWTNCTPRVAWAGVCMLVAKRQLLLRQCWNAEEFARRGESEREEFSIDTEG